MWFRNLALYRFTRPFELAPEALEEQLAARPARPTGPQELQASGWAPPLGRGGQTLVHAAGGQLMICARTEERILPPAAVRELLEERIEAIEANEGRRVKGREKRELREALVLEMLPRAFVRSRLQYAWIDPRGGWLVVDTATASRAEALLTLLRDTLGSLPVRPLAVRQSPAALFTAWLQEGRVPAPFEAGDACELRAPEAGGAVVRIRGESPFSEEVGAHLAAGKQVTRLALSFDERIRFVLDEQLLVRQLRFEDLVLDELPDADSEAERFDADFALMTGELGRLLPALVALFGGEAE